MELSPVEDLSAGIEELHRLNSVIWNNLKGDGRLPTAAPLTIDEYRHFIYRVVFGNDYGPPQLTAEGAKCTVGSGRFCGTRQELRTHILDIIEVLVKAQVNNPVPNPPRLLNEAEDELLKWLKFTDPSAEYSKDVDLLPPIRRTTGPLDREAAVRSIKPEHWAANGILEMESNEVTGLPKVDYRSHRPAPSVAISRSDQDVACDPQPILGTQMLNSSAQGHIPTMERAERMSPSREPMVYPAFGWTFPQHPPLCYAPQYPMMTHPGLYFQPVPFIATSRPLLNQPLPLMGTPHHPIPGPIQPPIMMNRESLPPADRQAIRILRGQQQHVAQPQGLPGIEPFQRRFNVAEWAQANRPPLSSSSSNSDPWLHTAEQTATPISSFHVRYSPTTDTMYLRSVKGPSQQLQTLLRNGLPTFTSATEDSIFPFELTPRTSAPLAWGVIRIDGIPFGLTKREVIAMLGPNTPIATYGSSLAIHITMDRLTGKTNDCFVEFAGVEDAIAVVNRKQRTAPNRLADRIVTISMSSQDELLRQLFPKAKNIEFQDGTPVGVTSTDPYVSDTKCLISGEELYALGMHATLPARSQFTTRCPQRVYECMISTLYKFPWYATELYTVGIVKEIFEATTATIQMLVHHVEKAPTSLLTPSLLQELLYAGLNAPGLSEKQHYSLTRSASVVGRSVRISPLTKDWPFAVLGRKPNIPEDVMEWYINQLTKHLNIPTARPTMNPFRTFTLPPNRGLEATVQEMGEGEMKCVLDIYKLTLDKK